VSNAEVANTNILHLARRHQLLHLAPRVNVIPVWVDLLHVIWVRAARPVDQVQVNIVSAQVLERGVNALDDALVPWVVKLGREPDLAAGDAGGLDASADFGFVLVAESSVDVALGKLGIGGMKKEGLMGAETYGSHHEGRSQRPFQLLRGWIAMFPGRWREPWHQCSECTFC
jgi:hypothetical protein